MHDCVPAKVHSVKYGRECGTGGDRAVPTTNGEILQFVKRCLALTRRRLESMGRDLCSLGWPCKLLTQPGKFIAGQLDFAS